ncbi:hypothetical protein BDV95DRAFT_468050, partial [Massariosphaeria phaeospora]
RNEFPSTYRSYKAYTTKFTGWLVKTAEKRGLELQTQVSKGGKTKNRKGTSVHTLKIWMYEEIAQYIIDAGEPLEDDSGLKDLEDAIRSRKEVMSWYKVKQQEDEAHSFFTEVLTRVKSRFQGSRLAGAFQGDGHTKKGSSSCDKTTTVKPDNPKIYNVTIVNWDADPEVEEEPSKSENRQHANSKSSNNDRGNRQSSTTKIQSPQLTKAQMETELDFEVLCFLYDLSKIRKSIRTAWEDYKDDNTGVIAAALVSDLAQGLVQQNVLSVVEDLGADPEGRSLRDIVKKLFTKSLGDGKKSLVPEQKAYDELYRLFCMDGIHHLEAYEKRNGTLPSTHITLKADELPHMQFLLFFEGIRKKIPIPILDKFTEGMQSSRASKEWLPFGFQILIDINLHLGPTLNNIYTDIGGHVIHLSSMMRLHCDFEDNMSTLNNPPDYMTKDPVKFTSLFIGPLASIMKWIDCLGEEVEEDDSDDSDVLVKMDAELFVTFNPVLSGLVTYYYQMTYDVISIPRMQWFFIALAHLYNACSQVGGLTLPWPDLDFVIKMQDSKRIFISDPPTEPDQFFGRLLVGMSGSSRNLAKDHNKMHARLKKELKAKRGFSTFFPLEQKIREYYGPNPNNDRWIRLHNVFAHVLQIDAEQDGTTLEESGEAAQVTRDVQGTFNSVAADLAPQKSKNRKQRQKKKEKQKQEAKVQVPDFSKSDCAHVTALSRISAELRSNELHTCFDYLSFFRRVFSLVTQIRDDVLYDASMQIARPGPKESAPHTHQLLHELFYDLKTPPKDIKVEAKGHELSKDVLPLDKIKAIARIMQDLIAEEGSAELDAAEHFRKCLW